MIGCTPSTAFVSRGIDKGLNTEPGLACAQWHDFNWWCRNPCRNQSFDFSGVRIGGRTMAAALEMGSSLPFSWLRVSTCRTLLAQNVDVFRAGIDRRYRRPLQRGSIAVYTRKFSLSRLRFSEIIEQGGLSPCPRSRSFVAETKFEYLQRRRVWRLAHFLR